MESLSTHKSLVIAGLIGAVVFFILVILAVRLWWNIAKAERVKGPEPEPDRGKDPQPEPVAPNGLRELTKDNWANFEKTVPNLITVIVVAHKVSRPDGALYDAVVENLQKRVRYKFLVSQSTAKTEENVWYGMFKQLAIGLEKEGNLEGAGEAVEILKLPYDWDDYPYVFYLQGKRSAAAAEEVKTTVAFRGTDQKKGICNSYREVPAEEAQTLARVLMQGEPGPIVETMRQAVESNFEAPLPQNLDVDNTKGAPA